MTRPTVILLKFKEMSVVNTRTAAIFNFFGSDNVSKPQVLDELTYKVLWVNPNFPPKNINAERFNAASAWKAGEVLYAYEYPE